jgi:ATP-binding cassette subfamily C protein CydCD
MYFSFKLWSFTKGVRLRIALAVLLGLATAAAGVARLALLGWVIARVFRGEPLESLTLPIIAVAGAVFLRATLQYFKETVAHHTAALVQLSIRRAVFDRALALGPSYFDSQRTGDVTITLVEGVEQLETFFGQYLPQLFTAALTPIGVFVFMAFLDLPTAGIILGFALLTLLAPSMFHRWNRRSSQRRRRAYGSFGAEYLDAVQGLATLKAFGQSGARARALGARAHEVFRTTMWVLASNSATHGAMVLGIAFGAGTALGYGATRVSSGDLSLTVLLVVLMLGVEVFRPLRELGQLFHQGLNGVSAATGLFEILGARPMVRDVDRPVEDRAVRDAGIEFRQVTFRYPGGRRPALEDVSLEVSAGERVGVVGRSGSGKSTLMWLAQRLYDPQGGQVLLGGQDLRNLSFDQIRSRIAVVAQDTYLFHGTVADNLRFGRPDATRAEIEAAARVANAHDFIAALPKGYDTVIGERGVRLSGGQRQRIAIARALLLDAPVLILDEALSSVDAENEAVIQEALNRLMAGRTTMIMAHRLSSVIGADRIVVLEQGRVVETGRHAELLRAGGAYARLMARQAADVAARGPAAPERAVVPDGRPLVSDGRPTAGAAGGAPGPDVAGASEEHEMAPTDAILRAEGLGWFGATRVLLRLIRPWRVRLTVTFVLGVLRLVGLLGVGVVSALIVARVRVGEPFGVLFALLFVVAGLAAALTWLEDWLAHDMAFRLLSVLRIDLFSKLDRLAPAYLQRRRTGDLVAMATQDVETVEYFFAHLIAPAFVAAVVPLAVLGTLFAFAWPAALALAPFLALAACSPIVARAQIDRLGSRARERLGALNAHAVETIQGMREVLAFRRGPERRDRFLALTREYLPVRLSFNRDVTVQRVALEVLTGLGGLTVLVLLAWLAVDRGLDRGLLPMLTLLAMGAFVPVSEIAQVGRRLGDTLGATRRLVAVHDEPVPVVDGPGVGLPPRGRPLGVRMEGVAFSYDVARGPVLEGLDLEIPAGKTVAVVGPSGAGKTTAAHLLLRFWDPGSGRILLDGHDLREFRLDELRSLIALVAQDTYVFNASIRENLLIARPDASESQLRVAIENCALAEFVESLPDGLDTRVGERGMQLSGGQRQRVAIGRAFLKDSPVLILDEATSHLDAVSEGLVRGALDRLMADRTTVVIAHRLSTVRNADRILVMDRGRVVEAGTHAELAARAGLYAHLIAAQVAAGAIAAAAGGSDQT